MDARQLSRGRGVRRHYAYEAIIALASIAVLSVTKPAEANQVTIDTTAYLNQSSDGQAICTDQNVNYIECVHAYPNQYGETDIVYAQQSQSGSGPVVVGIDYITRSTNSAGANGGYYIGVSRSADLTDGLRCFSNPGQFCTAPPSTSAMPEDVPRLLTLNVVLPSDDDAASSAMDKSPIAHIAGGINISGLTYFQTVNMDINTCAQTLTGIIPYAVYASFLYQYDFQGMIGVQDALVIEEIEYQNVNGQIIPNHIERYYYVNGYGRVRDSIAFWDVNSQQYTDQGPNGGFNVVRPWVRPVSVMPPEPPNYCPQGTYPLAN